MQPGGRGRLQLGTFGFLPSLTNLDAQRCAQEVHCLVQAVGSSQLLAERYRNVAALRYFFLQGTAERAEVVGARYVRIVMQVARNGASWWQWQFKVLM